MSRLGLTRDKIYKTVARQLHGVVPCWVCGEHVLPASATLEHIRPLSEGGTAIWKTWLSAMTGVTTSATPRVLRRPLRSVQSARKGAEFGRSF